MQIRKWAKPDGSEVRYYIDLRFGAPPFLSYQMARLLNGRWVGCDDGGNAHVYAKTQAGTGRCRTEDGEGLDVALLGSAPRTFAEWEAVYTACLTKSGNFSVPKYMKL